MPAIGYFSCPRSLATSHRYQKTYAPALSGNFTIKVSAEVQSAPAIVTVLWPYNPLICIVLPKSLSFSAWFPWSFLPYLCTVPLHAPYNFIRLLVSSKPPRRASFQSIASKFNHFLHLTPYFCASFPKFLCSNVHTYVEALPPETIQKRSRKLDENWRFYYQ